MTLRVVGGIPSLRRRDCIAAMRESFAKACNDESFRLLHYSIQRDHLHLIVEADGHEALGRGMKSVGSRARRRVFRQVVRRVEVPATRCLHKRPPRNRTRQNLAPPRWLETLRNDRPSGGARIHRELAGASNQRTAALPSKADSSTHEDLRAGSRNPAAQPRASYPAAGSTIATRVPRPGSLCTENSPPWCVTI